MVYAFTESEKKQIESYGMAVVEFKQKLKKMEAFLKSISEAWNDLTKLVGKISKIIDGFCKKFYEAMDNMRLVLEEIRESYNYPTSRRYKVVKILCKWTGMEKREVWKKTRRKHLARSCC